MWMQQIKRLVIPKKQRNYWLDEVLIKGWWDVGWAFFCCWDAELKVGCRIARGQREARSWWFFCGGVWELLIFFMREEGRKTVEIRQTMQAKHGNSQVFFEFLFLSTLSETVWIFLSLSVSQFAVWLLLHVKIKPINTCYRLVNFSMVIETIKILTRSCQSQEQRSWRVSLGRSSVDLVSLEYVIRGFEGNLLMLCMHLCVHTIDAKIMRSRDMQCNNCEESPLET